MTRHVHFVGSIGLDSVEEVFTTAGGVLKQSLKRCPDGEVGGRKLWISYQWPVLRATSFLKPASDNAIPGMGLCTLHVKPTSRPDEIHFGELGYAREARTSYGDFLKSRSRGILGRDTRFQVCLPTPAAVIGAFVVPQDIPKVLPAYTAAMLREVESICSAIPHEDLAIQWDVCIEMIQWDARSPLMPPFPGMEQAFAAAFAVLTAAVPETVELGIHLCYGDMDAKHFIEPVDLSKAVSLANLITRASPRSLNWIHMPVPMDREDAAYFSPLQELVRGPSTDLFLGLVHAADGSAGAVRRMKAASAFSTTFGIATECGMGRARTPQMVRELLGIHAEAAQAFP